MSDTKVLGISIVVAAMIVAGAIIWHAFAQRYQLVVDGNRNVYVQDTVTGDTYIGGKNLHYPKRD